MTIIDPERTETVVGLSRNSTLDTPPESDSYFTQVANVYKVRILGPSLCSGHLKEPKGDLNLTLLLPVWDPVLHRGLLPFTGPGRPRGGRGPENGRENYLIQGPLPEVRSD